MKSESIYEYQFISKGVHRVILKSNGVIQYQSNSRMNCHEWIAENTPSANILQSFAERANKNLGFDVWRKA